MAAGRPRKPSTNPTSRRTRVAGRNSPRVEVTRDATDPRLVDDQTPVDETTADGGSKDDGRSVSGVERKRRAAQAAREEERETAEALDEGPAPRDTESTLRLASIVGAVAIVLGAIAAVLGFHPGAGVTGNRAFVDKPATDRLISEATDAVCASFRFDYQNLDKWFATIGDSLTGEALDSFRKYQKTNRDLATQRKSAQDCQVESLGVQNLDGDTATVLVQMVVSTTNDGMIAESYSVHVQYTLQREDGRWKVAKVSDF